MQKCAAIWACQVRHLPFTNLNLLDSPPLVFPPREALYKSDRHDREESKQNEGGKGEFLLARDSEFLDKAIKGYHVGSRDHRRDLC